MDLKTILALKVKRRRRAVNLTLAELAARSRLSISYLAEIEGGKKYPKPERLLDLAAALGCSYDELASTKLEGDDDLLQKILSTPSIRDFPFDMFGVPSGDLMKLLTRSPGEVTALLRALTDIAREYGIGAEHFVEAALRSYQEVTGNFYEDLEESADAFARSLSVSGHRARLHALKKRVGSECGYTIDTTRLGQDSVLGELHAIVLDGSQRLLINPGLGAADVSFLLAREAGYKLLGLSPRSATMPAEGEVSFEQALNDFKASYFAGAVLLPRGGFGRALQVWLRQTTWQAASLLRLSDAYGVTLEILMQRLSQLMPKQFGLHAHFFKFTESAGVVQLVKQLNLSGVAVPRGIRASEHYCQRWLSTRLLADLRKLQRQQPARRQGSPLIGVQRSRFTEHDDASRAVSTDESYFCLGSASVMPLHPNVITSSVVGFRVDERQLKTVRFAKDRTVPTVIISGTCERCGLGTDACADRVAPAHLYQRRLALSIRQRTLADLSAP